MANMGKPRLAFDGQSDGARFAVEQSDAKMLLELTDPLADRRLRQADLTRGSGKAAKPGGCLECTYPFERRKAISFHKQIHVSRFFFLICVYARSARDSSETVIVKGARNAVRHSRSNRIVSNPPVVIGTTAFPCNMAPG